jgi:hypothetical protein
MHLVHCLVYQIELDSSALMGYLFRSRLAKILDVDEALGGCCQYFAVPKEALKNAIHKDGNMLDLCLQKELLREDMVQSSLDFREVAMDV